MNDTKISKNREKKATIVAEVAEKVGKAKLMVFTNYQGMTHRQLEALKKGLRQAEAELAITKNTLLKRSLQSTAVDGSPLTIDDLQGPTATIFAYGDVVTPLRELAKSIKNLKLPGIKFGILEGKMLTAEEVVTLSTLPSREVLLAQFVGGLKSPIYGLHRALNWNLVKLAMIFKAIENKKSTI